jgi:beta-hydroxylase
MIMYTGVSLVLLFTFASIVYVYRFRGNSRYASFTEYLRKGWPLTTPMNSVLYLFTQKRAKPPVMSMQDFPELSIIQENWETIRDEAKAVYEGKHLENTTDPNSDSYYDLGFRTFYKYGWSKFYITWYGTTLNSAARLMPKTVEIMKKCPTVNGSMLTILPPGSQLTRHLDPVACSLRYHLGLMTPNDDNCFINVDGQNVSWRDGEGFLFDETFLHFAQNQTDKPRLILMCDVERPLSFFGKIFNFFYKIVTRASVVPNMEGDQRGTINAIFSGLAPILGKAKSLKETNKPLYKTLKWTVNFSIIGVVLLIVMGAFDLIQMALAN